MALSEPAARIAHIDGLRGVAALSVVVFHGGVHMAARPDPASPLGMLLRGGAHGVDLFFVLSGFCLSYPYLAAHRESGVLRFDAARFAARRLVRILPAYYAAIALLLAAGTIALRWGGGLPQSMDPASLSAPEVLKQLLFSGKHYLASPFWTLALEFRWYFLFPFALWLWTRSRALFGLAAAIALAAAGPLHNYDLFFLPVFMLGIVAADVHVRQDRRAAAIALAAFPAALAGAVALTARDGWDFSDRGPFWGIAMFCLVVAAGGFPRARAALSGRWIVTAGALSYGIYLIHEPVIEFAQRFAGFPASIVLALAAGALFSLLAEQPFVRDPLKQKLTACIERALHSVRYRSASRPWVLKRG